MALAVKKGYKKNYHREMALNAVMAIYNEEGYNGITIDKIAGRCELSRSLLYNYFKNKDDILINAAAIHTKYFIDLLQNLYNNREYFRMTLLEELWSIFIKFYQKSPETFNALSNFIQSGRILNAGINVKDFIRESLSTIFSLHEKIVGYGINENIFIKCNPETLAEIIWTSFLGIINLEQSKRKFSRKNKYKVTSDMALSVLSRGILNKQKINNNISLISSKVN